MNRAIPPVETVADLVQMRPERADVFEQFGIDYCCHGRVSLDEACQRDGADTDLVRQRLREADAQPADDQYDWSTASLSQLADHIVAQHHAYLRGELPRLSERIDRVVTAHGDKHPELREVRSIFAALRDEMTMHMMKEEQVLFPMIRQLESTAKEDRGSLQFHCGTLRNPIQAMEHEHDDAGAALRRLRELTFNYTPPPDACETFRVVLAGLQRLEADMHRHVHKENNILFPRALKLESGN